MVVHEGYEHPEVRLLVWPHPERRYHWTAKAARSAGLAIKLTKAGLTTKKPEAQRKATTKEAAQRAMDQQIAKFKAMGLKASDIKEMLSAMAATLK